MNFQYSYMCMKICFYLQMSMCDIPTGIVAENEETVLKLCATIPN